ncbi:MAG: tripartite tricarboxylate transporter TctB family protein [Betaproteobacteria bacterium]|nr:tripartite tricarboxylate transporter TctB family protein [Betaproteobacteria bacterium]
MKFNDAISGSALLALAIAILVNIQSFPKIPGQSIGPAAFPGLLAGLLAACAVVLIVRGLKERAGSAWVTPGEWLRSPHHLGNFLLTIGVLLFYILASEKLGFVICGVVLLASMFWKLRVRPALILPISLGATLLIHAIFYKGLRVPLPWGVLLPVAW